MEIAIAVFIGVWFTLAGGFSTWMVTRDFKKEVNNIDKGEGNDE